MAERAGSCPAFPLIEMCFRSGLSEREVKHRVLGRGGAVAFFGTNDLRELERRTAFIAPTEVYPGENELDSLAENGYLILAGETKIHRYDKDRLLDK